MKFFADEHWTGAAVTSLLVGGLTMALSTVLGTLAAIGVVRGRFPGRPLVVAVILSPLIVPSVVVALGMYVVYVRVGLAGTLFGLVVAHTAMAFPFVVVNVAASLRATTRKAVERPSRHPIGGTPDRLQAHLAQLPWEACAAAAGTIRTDP